MGGKSKKQTTTSQTSTNLVNDGDYAGASGVTHDESDNSIDDSYNTETNIDQEYNYESDSSINDSNNTETNIDQDTDSSTNDSNNTEIESDSSINDSNNTETNIDQEYEYSGVNSGNQGTINMLDGGAINAAGELVGDALDKVVENSQAAIDSANANLAKSLEFGSEALSGVVDTARFSIEEIGEQSEVYADNLLEGSKEFTNALAQLQAQSASSNATVLQHIADSSTEDKEIIAELARNAALEGQDIVANTSASMVKWVSIGLGLIGAALVIKG